ncbi:competence ComEA-like helix-hairpin-helix protein [Lacinutrix venerupis]|uniref:ComEA family DNA-binding protein n=1 Tax=Lacinutrix venerupis TaxID=1486034 RepID=UPI000EB2949E|nr:helix-hairpin-helix domain-containing protein [Lacinutrix venerupis]RLJ67101.1 competence ComEA-like helix-hairpin-helix protein [Lacinutrix venerupis]
MNIKSHFKFSKQQRNGIFLLLVLIIVLQCVYAFVEFPLKDVTINSKELEGFQAEIDSLKLVEIENRKPKIYPFNPNFITDYKGYALGMSNEEIDRLLKFRAKNQWINSAKQFQQVTEVSDSVFNRISPYFKFPDWVTNPKPKKQYAKSFNTNKPKTEAQKIDLNKATVAQLQSVYGIGEYYANSIVKYRTKQNGFISMVELGEVYGLKPETIEEIKKSFTLKTPREINKININTATKAQLVTVRYIDYEIAHNIIEYRTLHEGIKSLDDLIKVKDFPVKKIEIIKLYLQLN